MSGSGVSLPGGGAWETGVNTGASQDTTSPHPSPKKTNTRVLGDRRAAGRLVNEAAQVASLSTPLARLIVT